MRLEFALTERARKKAALVFQSNQFHHKHVLQRSSFELQDTSYATKVANRRGSECSLNV